MILSNTASPNARFTIFNLVNAEDTTQQIGGIAFSFNEVAVDDKVAYLSRANDTPDNTSYNPFSSLQKNVTIGWTATQQRGVALEELNLLAGKTFTADFTNRISDNRSYILPNNILIENGIDITGRTDFIGQAVLTFNFSI